MAYPCGDCGRNCVKSVVACESCDRWFHIRCQNLSKAQFGILSESGNCGFYCFGCTHKNGEYDYDMALNRLGNYSKAGVLEEGVQVEKILLRKANLEPLGDRSDLTIRSDLLIEDKVSSYLLQSVGTTIPGKLPIYVNGNGNCLFNAISMALFGHDGLATEIRTRTCIELVENSTSYEIQYDRLKLVSPTIQEACLQTAFNHSFSSAWAMVAAASVIGCPIQSVYPPKNGILDKTIGILNQIFFPLGKNHSKTAPIFILWTRTGACPEKTWTPNHFVPILDKPDRTMIDIANEEEFPSLSASPEVPSDSYINCPTIFHSTFVTEPSENSESGMQNMSDTTAIENQSIESTDSQNQSNLSLESETIRITESLYENTDSEKSVGEENASEKTSEIVSTKFRKLDGKFMSTDRLIDLLSTDTNEIYPEIVKDKKENVYFLIDNSENLKRKQNNKRMEFWDNCGTWDSKSSSTKTTYFTNIGTRFISVVKKESQYCTEVKKKFVPVDPQPKESEIFILKRFYSSLKRDKSYKKRISWFENMPGYPEKFKTLAVAEYLGLFPVDEISVHGNARKTKQEYIRTSTKTKEIVMTEIKANKPVKEIFKEQFVSENPPRDSKMIENMKTKLKKEENPGNRQNNADDIQAILNLTAQPNPFVREVVQMAGCPPNIICYTEHQLKHLAKASKQSVVGVDRTFNLGACYVTTTVYQDFDLKRKGKDVSPIFLGPLYLHWDGTFQTYQRFFTHLAAVMETPLSESELGTNHLIIGSDEEKAIVKAIKASFPNSNLTLCTRHLEENLKRQLKDKVGMPDRNAKEIINEIFGPHGLTNLNTSVDFSAKSNDIERKYNEKVGPYLADKLIPTIRDHVHKIRKSDDRLPMNWKNNHCEAMNHIFKLNLNWKPAKLPDLVSMLEKEVKHQEALIRGSLYGHGDFELSEDAHSLRVSLSSWQQKTEHEKLQHYLKFLKFGHKKGLPEKHLTSIDGKLIIPKTTTVAKKPGQKRRIKQSKTLTFSKRQRTE